MKKQLLELEDLLRSLGNLYQFDIVITASVLVQNMAFHADDWTESDFQPYLSILKKMKEFDKNNHILSWAYDEAHMLIDVHFMSDYMSESEPEYDSAGFCAEDEDLECYGDPYGDY